MNCLNCGKENDDNILKCLYCNSDFAGETVKGDVSADSTDKTVLDETDRTVLDGQSEVEPRIELKKIGKYTIIRRLGRGGMGEVFLAHDPDLDREVALKTMIAGEDASEKAIARFMSEARSAGKLQHPGIVGVHEVGKERNLRFMVMDYVEGETLKELIDEGSLTAQRSAEIIRDVAQALHYAHEQGIIHRDIKPGNIMLKKDGSVHLMDFGLARNLESDSSLTKSGEVMGTPAYLNPEQAGGESRNVDARSDVYSLGAVFYEMLTGNPPVRGTNLMQILYQVLEKETLKPTALNPSIPRDLEIICLKAMFKEPGRRYQTAGELAGDLRRFLDGEPIFARSASIAYVVKRKILRNKAVSAVTVIAVAILIISSIWYVLSLRKALTISEERREKAEYEAFVGNINLAGKLAEEGAFRKAEMLLDSIPPRNRHWEWGRIKYLCQRDILTLEVHNKFVQAVTISPDGKWILTGAEDNTAKLIDFKTGEVLTTFEGHTNLLRSVDFSPDSKRIITGSVDGTARVWDTKTGGELLRVVHPGHVRCVDWSPDKKSFVTAGDSYTAIVWDAETGEKKLTLECKSDYWDFFTSARFSPDNKRIVTGDSDGKIVVWDVTTGQKLLVIKAGSNAGWSTCFSPDSTRIVSGGGDRTAKVWDAETGKELLELQGHTGSVRSVCFSSNGDRILTGSGDSTLKLWDSETGMELKTFMGHSGIVSSVCFSPEGDYILSGSHDNTIKIWDTRIKEDIIRIKNQHSRLDFGKLSPDGRYILAAYEDFSAKVYDAGTGQEITTLRGHSKRLQRVALSPDGSRILTGSEDNTARAWEIKTGKELYVMQGHTKTVTAVKFSPDGKHILTASSDGTAKVWDTETGKEIFTLKGHEVPWGGIRAEYSPDGKRIITTCWDFATRVWDAETGDCLLTHQNGMYRHFFDENRIFLETKDNRIKVWDIRTDEELVELKGGAVKTVSVCSSPDGKYILTGNIDSTARLWDAKTGEKLFELKGHAGSVRSVFSLDGKRIFSGSGGGAIKIWDVETGRELFSHKRHNDTITYINIFPDGKRIITAGHLDAVIIYPALDWTKTSEELEQEKLENWRKRWED